MKKCTGEVDTVDTVDGSVPRMPRVSCKNDMDKWHYEAGKCQSVKSAEQIFRKKLNKEERYV